MEDVDYSLLSQHGDNALWTLLSLVKIDAIGYMSGTYISETNYIHIGVFNISGTRFVTSQDMPKNYKLHGPR